MPNASDNRSPKSPWASGRVKRCVTRNELREPRHPQRGRQRDEREVGLRGIDRAVGVPLVGRRGGLRASGGRIGGRLRERRLQVNREQERNGRETFV